MSAYGYLSDWDWVRSAADPESVKPVLRAVHATEGQLVATNGHLLHAAPNTLIRPGLWDATTHRAVEGTFPKWGQTVTTGPATHEIHDLGGVLTLLRGIARFQKTVGTSRAYATLPGPEGPVVLDPEYLATLLRGFAPAQEDVRRATTLTSVLVTVGEPGLQVKFEMPGIGRMGVLMPLRMGAGFGAPPHLFDLSEFVSEVAADVAPVAVESAGGESA